MLSVKAQSVLRRIRSSVKEGRWIKGRASDGYGNFCLAGHVYNETDPSFDYETRREVTDALTRVIRTRQRDGFAFGTIPSFNDYRRTTEEDIVAVIDEAMRSQ